MIRIVVTGGRHYEDWQRVNEVLDKLHKERGVSHLLNGGAGTNHMKKTCRTFGIEVMEIQ